MSDPHDIDRTASHRAVSGPSPWVERFAPLVPAGGTVLDLACGGGRHSRLFSDRGHPVLALDIDTSAVAEFAGAGRVEVIEADLESDGWPFGARRFAGIVVVNYLWRPLLPRLAAALDGGGTLIYETFAVGNERYGRPRNPDHLLQPGELLQAFAEPLCVVAYEHGVVDKPRPAVLQRIVAVRRDAPSPLPP